MVRVHSKCPPGVLCISSELILVLAVLIAAAGAIAFIFYKGQEVPLTIPQRTMTTTVISPPQGGDDRYTRAPKPERNWAATPDLSAIWNSGATLPAIPTRGIPETYQSMGTIRTEDGQILPLYGRRTASRSDRFQYYTRTDTYNPVQIPIEYKRRSCQDDVGCEELYDRDRVNLGPLQKSGEVTVYRFSGPTYIPI
jgi:hypothetical protein